MVAMDGCFYPDKFARQLRKLRQLHGYTHQEIAKKLYIERSTYTWYELGETQPSIEILIKLAALYGVSVDCLLGIEREWSVKELACHLFVFFMQYFETKEQN